MDNQLPLDGIVVADFSKVYAGPICSRMLGDCGASITKVEPMGIGDNVRATDRVFAHFNAGKRSVQIDLSTTEGVGIANRLIDTADVVIENFRPGVMKRFGLDHDTVRERRPEVVYCSISGFGQTGPDSQRAAYAPIAHAASGFDMAHMRAQHLPDPLPDDSRPPASGIMIADMLTGAYAFGAIQTALIGREKTGRGDHIDISMLESMMMLIPGQQQMAQRPDPSRPGGGFQPVRTTDGFVMVCIVSDKNFAGVCTAIGREDVREDPRYQRPLRFKNMKALVTEIEAWSVQLNTQQCEAQLNKCGVPCSRYNAIEDLFDDAQLKHRETFTQFTDDDGDFLVQNAPFRLAETDTKVAAEVAQAGQHSRLMLRELGYSAEQISELLAQGVISAAD